jgi:asparagine synthase (glutamine-hydrolysing)
MCGIAGFIVPFEVARRDESLTLIDKMCRVITHRGPDEQGTAVIGRAAIGMRRLSIIDLLGGQQPIYNEDGNLAIVFNGEIYNYRELKKELEQRGHRFKTNSDTETIVHAFEEYGERCVEHLRGMFAFAIWDETKQELFIARDRVGKKPLYYTTTGDNKFLFGSELKVLLEHGGFGKKINQSALDAYLAFGYVPDPLCIFENVHKLAPGHWLKFKNNTVETQQYWDFSFQSETKVKSEKEYVEELNSLLEEAVRVRLISEVPLGAFLSGGVDSSTIVGLMSRILEQPVKTFSIGFNEDSYNELKFARLAAKHFGTEHHEFVVTPDLYEIVHELVWHFDEPFADQSSLPTYMLSKMAREYVTVVLSGDGGDELFAGYTRYLTDQKRSGFAKLPKFLRQNVLQTVSANLPHGAIGRNFLHNISLEPLERYINSVSQISKFNRSALYSADFRQTMNGTFGFGEQLFQKFAETVSTGNPIDSLLYLDSKTYLPGDILTKVDRMTMATSLEARVPLLDHKLIEFVTRIPADLKLKGRTTKYIFKQAVRGLVPNEILDRPKQGFGVPIEHWINQQLRQQIRADLIGQRLKNRGLFDLKYINLLLDEHERGRRDHSPELWILWMLELWFRKFVD